MLKQSDRSHVEKESVVQGHHVDKIFGSQSSKRYLREAASLQVCLAHFAAFNLNATLYVALLFTTYVILALLLHVNAQLATPRRLYKARSLFPHVCRTTWQLNKTWYLFETGHNLRQYGI